MSEIKCRCGKTLKASMEVEYSSWINEFFCSPDCATDRYFEYMESTPVDFENILPEGIEINSDGVLVKDAEHRVYLTGGQVAENNGQVALPTSG